ncbi:hypothetical protein G7047_20715 [Diaphorobacter sp. HDW4A]|uniref:hypothetical protein n=1 Tax=Diaphorobacter sp. HDW4A TaxID=2714924 RepID=UPI001407B3E5|nr:hypothetical protein [Diaphorobacter sp. HDW4A]QIL82079.1 hypothetical protein G7047_20715 [Diaphorobacter sp. HDW4A]
MTMHLHVLARLLRHADSVLRSAYLAFAFTLLVWIVRNGQFITCWVLVALAMLLIALQHYVAVRVKFDADLLEHVARMIDSGTSERGATQMLDDSLVHFGLMPSSKARRDWALRFEGCLRLFKLQIGLLVLQYALMVAMVIVCTTPSL